MKHFTIDNEKNLTLHVSRKAARETNLGVFSTEEQFADTIGNDNQRLIEIWNSLPGVTPVKKFTNRKIATERIWKAIQTLGSPTAQEPEVVAEPAEPVAQPPQAESVPQTGGPPAAAESTPIDVEQQHTTPEPDNDSPAPETGVAPAESAHETVAATGAQTPDVAPSAAKATKKASRPKKVPGPATNASAPREGSKTSRVIAMLRREGGATLEEIMSEMAWQQHTTRALMSAGGALAKKHGVVVTSEKVGDKRTYFIKP